jgi:ribokinase
MLSQPAFKVDCIDSTGAGDTFCGALVAALARGAELTQALRQASAAGALACTHPGAQSSVPTQSEVNRLLT